jgi:hypothetical protein
MHNYKKAPLTVSNPSGEIHCQGVKVENTKALSLFIQNSLLLPANDSLFPGLDKLPGLNQPAPDLLISFQDHSIFQGQGSGIDLPWLKVNDDLG